jgi:hydroxylamine reductase
MKDYKDCKNKSKKTAKGEFKKTTTIGEVLETNPKYRKVLEGFGLHCFGCPMSQMETLEEASLAHEIDLEFMLDKLNNSKI